MIPKQFVAALSPADPVVPGRVGVLMYDASIAIDALLVASVKQIRARGIMLGGLLQRFGEARPDGRRSLWLDDLLTGEILRLDTPCFAAAAPHGASVGRVAEAACASEATMLTRAACALQRAISAKVDTLLISRFGIAEVSGRGLRAEFADAVCSGVSVLVAVRCGRLNDLEKFLGGPAHLLLPAPTAIADWAESAARRRD
jgi:hypothetical protein